jgi:uncharacterized membrane protein
MEQTKKKTGLRLKLAAAVLLIIVVVVAAFSGLTFPRAVLSFPVSFAVGADVVHKTFEVPELDGVVQVQVAVNSGSALWTAIILSSDSTVWTHRAAQGGQTTYISEWITISTGTYNFSFATAGMGSLSAEITVKAKGGFW